MLEKCADAILAYGFSIIDLFDAFAERTSTVVALGIPLLIMVLVHSLLPSWVAAAVVAFVFAPAAASMATMILECLSLPPQR